MRALASVLGIVITTGVLQAQGTTTMAGAVRDETETPIRNSK
jgi:hypothetical protein